MQTPNFTNPQFLDADGVGGMNPAMGVVSGAIASVGTANWAVAGLIAPEAMTVATSGMVMTVGLPSPWGIVTPAGIVVRAHGTQTGQDTTNYSANFAPLVPATGTVTAFLIATIAQIQQNPFPIPGPPQGDPAYNPNYVPAQGYAKNLYTVGITASITGPNNNTTYELARSTLTPGQTVFGGNSISGIGQVRTGVRLAKPYTVISSGGALTPDKAQLKILFGTPVTETLPVALSTVGLTFEFTNASGGNCIIAAAGSDGIVGGPTIGPVTSLTIPNGSSVSLYSTGFVYYVTQFSPSWISAVGGDLQGFLPNPLFNLTLQHAWIATQQFLGAIRGDATGLAINNNANSVNNIFVSDVGFLTTRAGIAANTGDITSNLGKLRAGLGSGGDPNAATLLVEFPFGRNAFGVYAKLPSGLIIQAGLVISVAGGFGAYNLPTAFPNECLSMTATDDGIGMGDMGIQPGGGYGVSTGFFLATAGYNNGFGNTPTYPAGIGINWMAIGY